MSDKLEIGDRVVVGWANDQCSLTGTVRHKASNTGECWIIEEDDGTPWYLQQFEFIRLAKAEDY